MPQFLETILCKDAKAHHLSYHQQRVDRVAQKFNFSATLSLEDIISPPSTSQTLRCRVLYDATSFQVSYHEYVPKKIERLKVIELADNFDYTFKYANRDFFSDLHTKYPQYDEFILLKDGLVTDCTIANLAIYDAKEKKFISPSKPLLEGTTRQRLYGEGKLLFQDITLERVKNSSPLYLLNAMIGLFEVKNAIIH